MKKKGFLTIVCLLALMISAVPASAQTRFSAILLGLFAAIALALEHGTLLDVELDVGGGALDGRGQPVLRPPEAEHGQRQDAADDARNDNPEKQPPIDVAMRDVADP